MTLSVNAEEVDISCSTTGNLIKPNNFIVGIYKPFDYSPNDNYNEIGYITHSYASIIPVESMTSYKFFADVSYSGKILRIAIAYYDEDFNYISYFNERVTSPNFYYSFTTIENSRYVTLHLYIDGYSSQYQGFADELNSVYYHFSKTDVSRIDYEQCPVEVKDTTLDNFYSIYVTKLKELSEFTIENKFVLSAFVIVLIFALLASFIHLFGRRKS